jgi:hypothetical protein
VKGKKKSSSIIFMPKEKKMFVYLHAKPCLRKPFEEAQVGHCFASAINQRLEIDLVRRYRGPVWIRRNIFPNSL